MDKELERMRNNIKSSRELVEVFLKEGKVQFSLDYISHAPKYFYQAISIVRDIESTLNEGDRLQINPEFFVVLYTNVMDTLTSLENDHGYSEILFGDEDGKERNRQKYAGLKVWELDFDYASFGHKNESSILDDDLQYDEICEDIDKKCAWHIRKTKEYIEKYNKLPASNAEQCRYSFRYFLDRYYTSMLDLFADAKASIVSSIRNSFENGVIGIDGEDITMFNIEEQKSSKIIKFDAKAKPLTLLSITDRINNGDSLEGFTMNDFFSELERMIGKQHQEEIKASFFEMCELVYGEVPDMNMTYDDYKKAMVQKMMVLK